MIALQLYLYYLMMGLVACGSILYFVRFPAWLRFGGAVMIGIAALVGAAAMIAMFGRYAVVAIIIYTYFSTKPGFGFFQPTKI